MHANITSIFQVLPCIFAHRPMHSRHAYGDNMCISLCAKWHVLTSLEAAGSVSGLHAANNRLITADCVSDWCL